MRNYVIVFSMKVLDICNVIGIKAQKQIKILPMNLNIIHTVINRQIATAVLSCLLVLACAVDISAQGWEKIYGDGGTDEGTAVLQTKDEGYAICGSSNEDIFILKTDPDGEKIWLNYFGDPSFFELGKDMVITDDGSYVVVGTRTEGGGADANKFIVVYKVNEDGDLVWGKVLNQEISVFSAEASAIANTADGGFIIAGNKNISLDNQDAYLIKLDADGEIVWERTYDFSMNDNGNDVIQSSDYGFLIVGSTRVNNTIFTDALVIKTDILGNQEWVKMFDSNNNFDDGNAVTESYDNHFVVTGFTGTTNNGWDIFFRKINSDGDVVAYHTYGGSSDDIGYSINETHDNGFVITGLSDISTSNGDVILIKTDDDGNEIWMRNHGRSYAGISADIGYAVSPTIDGGYIITGNFTKISFFDTDIYLIKTDGLGNIYSNYIEGNIYNDLNHNCIAENGENGIEDWIIVAEGEQTFYGTSDTNGDYSILVDTGAYDVHLVNPSYWEACVSNYNITFDTFYDTLQIDFAIHAEIPCALMEVDVATNATTPCEESVYHVNYCNHGTVTTTGAYVEIFLDENQALTDASIFYIAQDDNKYLFPIDDVSELDCGAFTFTATLSCEANIQEATCVEAHIYPDLNCLEENPAWDGSSLVASGECDLDSIRFQIENIGEGNMLSPNQNFIVIEDHLIYRQGPIGPLESGETKTLEAIPANGSTYRLIVEQSNGHPGYSYPTAAVEGCNNGTNETIYGELTQFPEDDADWFVSVDCHENTNSLAISYLEGYPKGYIQDTFYIAQSTDITYQLNFQNTGLTTATRIVLTDTIPEQLDITSVRPGASSHPYDFAVYNNGIVKFTFDNISLPSSSADEINSIGFVKFRIAQKPNLAPGTMVINRAATYLQYETPQKSDNIKHTIVEKLQDVLLTNIVEYPAPGFSGIEAFPNPFSESCTFEIKLEQTSNINFDVFDLTGKLVRKETHRSNTFEFNRKHLPAGTYVFRISSKGDLLGTGKLVIQ